ncbi:Thiamine-phosphate synthase [Alphaproteobacteria bacterium SO-S41]|nr:Thiamine-phosphate synthase [Alphaproteobacteria bacterium SO-S41]
MRTMRPPLPTLWLMTDDTRGDAAAAMRSLPHGAGVIFRHYNAPDRARLARTLRALAARRGLVFLVAGDVKLAAAVKADGFHAPEWLIHRATAVRRLLPHGLVTAAAHGVPGLVAAERAQVDAVLVSPVFATASHPGAQTLGVLRFAALAEQAAMPVIALGGMTPDRFARLTGTAVSGYAAISALQKPNENSVKTISASRSPT